MKIYIAGPMTGLPEFNYPAFREAEARLMSLDYETLNPITAEAENDTGKPQTWQWYMRRALRLVSEAEGVALLPGWTKSKGACLERDVATRLGLDVRPIGRWLK